MQSCIRYGDLVVLHYNTTTNIQELKSKNTHENFIEDLNGYLSATGYADQFVYFQSVENLEMKQTVNDLTQKSVHTITNYRDFVFQICPKLNYEFHKDYNKNMGLYKRLINITNLTQKQEELKQNFSMKLNKLSERIQKEQEQNESTLTQFNGQQVTYGSEIFLRHFDSKSFVCANNDSAQTNKIGYDCHLSDWFSDRMTFKICSKYKSRQDGEVVQYNDSVIFRNSKYNTFLSFSDEFEGDKDWDEEIEADSVFNEKNPVQLHRNEYRIAQTIIDPNSVRFKAYLSQESETAWQIHLYRSTHNRNQIKGGDFIRVKHTELNGYMASNLRYTDHTDVFVQKYTGEFPEEETPVSSIWEIQQNTNKFKGEIFHLKETNQEEYNFSKVSNPFRLRHYCTGRMFSVSSDENKCKLADISNDMQDYTLLSCEPILKHINTLNDGFTYYINQLDGSQLKNDKRQVLTREMIEAKFKNNPIYKEGLFQSLQDKDLDESRYPLFFQKEYSSEDAYYITLIPEKEVNEILFVRSALPTLKRMTQILRFKNSEVLTSDLYIKVENILMEVCFFLYDIKRNNDVNIFEQEDDPIPNRQKIVKDMKLIETLLDIIYLPFKSKMFELKKIQTGMMICQMLRMCYTTIRLSIKEYRPSELYCSQWLNLVMQQCLETNQENDILAGTTLLELIDNNRRILESRIEDSTIQRFVDFLANEQAKAGYVNIVRAMCICNDEPMIKNQKKVSKFLLEDQQTFNQLIFKLRLEGNSGRNTVLIRPMSDSEQKWVSIKEFKARSEAQDESQEFEFFVAMVKLLGDLCMGKNYIAIDLLRDLYTLEICQEIIMDSAQSPDLREAFSHLTQHLWIIVQPYNELNLPQKVITFENITSKIEIACSTQNIQKFQLLKNFILNHLATCFKPGSMLENIDSGIATAKPGIQGVKTSGSNKTEEQLKEWQLKFDSFNFSVLELCHTIVRLGFYSTTKELNELVDCLKDNLNQFIKNTNDQTNQQVQMIVQINSDVNGEENQVILNCTKKICQIFLSIHEIKCDYQMKLFIQKVKMMSSAKFSDLSRSKSKRMLRSIQQESKHDLISSEGIGLSEVQRFIESFDFSQESLDMLIKDTIIGENDIHMTNHEDFTAHMLNIMTKSNKDLQSLALDLFNKMFSYTQTFADNLGELIVIFDPAEVKEWQQIQQVSDELSDLCENCELWYSDAPGLQYNKTMMIISNLTTSCHSISNMQAINIPESERIQMMSQGKNLNQNMYAYQHVLQMSSKNTQNKLYQNLLREAGVFEALIEFLNYHLEMDCSNNSDSNIELISQIITLMSEMVRNNTKNKNHLSKLAVKKIIPSYLNLKGQEFHVYILVRELVSNNTELINDQEQIALLINAIFDKIESFEYEDLRKSICLNIFGDIISDLGENHKANLTYIIKRLFNQEQNRYIPKQGFLEDVYAYAATKSSIEHTKLETEVQKLPNRLIYFTTILNVLSICGEGKSAFAENIGQNYVKIETLYDYLMIPGLDFQIKQSLLSFYFHIYVDTEKSLPQYSTSHISKVLGAIFEEYGDLCEEKSVLRGYISKNQFFYPTGVQKGRNVLKGYFRLLMDLIKGVTSQNIISFQQEDQIELLENSSEQTKKLIANYSSNNSRNIEFLGYIEEMIIRFRRKNEEWTKKQSIQLSAKGSIRGANRSQASRRESIHNQPSSMSKSKKAFDMSDKKVDDELFDASFNQETDQDVEASESIDKVQRRMTIDSFFSKICECDIFQSISRSEYSMMSTNIQNIESVTESIKKKITFKELSISLMEFLKPGLDDISRDAKAIALLIFRNYIDSLSPENKSSIDWEMDDFKNEIKTLQLRQEVLIDLNIVELICQLVIEDDSNSLKISAIDLSISILMGGYHKSQMEFHDKLKNDPKNLFLIKLKEIIDFNFDFVLRKTALEQDLQLKNQLGIAKKWIKKNQQDEQSQVVYFQNTVQLRKIYRFLQLLCEGHNIELQDFLRKQSNDTSQIIDNNINFIIDTTSKFGSIIKQLNLNTEELIQQILDFLIDALQGTCLKNKQQLFQSKIVDFIKDMLKDYQIEISDQAETFEIEEKIIVANKVIKKSIKLLLTLFEGNDGAQYSRYISTVIEFQSLMSKLTEELIVYFTSHNLTFSQMKTSSIASLNGMIRTKTFDEELAEAFDMFIFIKMLNQSTGCYSDDIRSLKGLEKLTFNFFDHNTSDIEVLFEGHLQKIFFILHPATRMLTDSVKEDFMENCKRDTPNDKLIDLMAAAPPFFDLMDHFFNLANGFLKINQRLSEMIQNFSIIYSYLVNIFIFIVFEKRVENSRSFLVREFDDKSIYFIVIDIIFLTLGGIRFIVSIIVDSKLIIINGWRDTFHEYRKYMMRQSSKSSEQDQRILSILSKSSIDISSSERKEIIAHVSKMKGHYYVIPTLQYYMYNLTLFMNDGKFKWIVFYLASSLFAFLSGDRITYSFFMLEVVARSSTLKSIVEAITYNKRQLLLTATLGIFVVYIYSLFAYYFTNDTFFQFDANITGENVCTTVFQCFTTVFSLGPRSSGSVGDVILRQSYRNENKSRYYVRFLYDMSIFIIINVIFMNIVFGIVINTFAEMRRKKDDRDDDMQNVCFICSLPRNKFESTSDGFNFHVEKDHYVWNYIFYMYNLKKKDYTEYDGIESYIQKKIENEDINWFPMNVSISLEDNQETTQDIKGQIDDLITRVTKIQNQVENLNQQNLDDEKSDKMKERKANLADEQA